VGSVTVVTGFAARAARAFADILMPRFCIFCGAAMEETAEIDACEVCEAAYGLPDGLYCPLCAAERGAHSTKCPNCHNMRIAMAAATAYGPYKGRLRECVLDYKFNGRSGLARTLGTLAGRAARRQWPEVSFDAVAGIPLHRSRRMERGFDQAKELARHAARVVGAPFDGRLLSRTRATGSQVGLTRTARLANVRGAFKARLKRPVQRLLLVDDTMTTGATASEAARAAKRSGAREVYVVVVARAALGVEGIGAAGRDAGEGEGT
jgi:ComF family protein